MKNILFVLSCFLLINFTGCKPEKSNTLETLKSEVIGIHDEVMPKMSEIHKNKKMLQKALEVVSVDNKEIILLHIQKLEEADEAMMSWMGDYKIPVDEEEAIKYLQDQRNEITRVKNLMLKAIEKSSDIIKQYETIQ
jgi:prefoldin subunit 5